MQQLTQNSLRSGVFLNSATLGQFQTCMNILHKLPEIPEAFDRDALFVTICTKPRVMTVVSVGERVQRPPPRALTDALSILSFSRQTCRRHIR